MRVLLLNPLIIAVCVLAGSPAPARSQTHLTLLPESRVTLRGASTLHRFACTASGLQGAGTYADGRADATIRVQVADLDCGRTRMNDDLRATLHADDHPTITFVLEDVRIEEDALRLLTLRVTGRLSLAGATRSVVLLVEAARCTDGTYRATATAPLRMSTFALSPPTALLGLVRVNDRIDVAFDLVAVERPPAARR